MAIGRAAGLVDQRHMIADGLHEQHWMVFRCGSATMDLQWYIYNGVYAGWSKEVWMRNFRVTKF